MRTVTKDGHGTAIWLGDLIAMYGYLSDDGYDIDYERDKRPWGVIWETEVTHITDGGCIEHGGSFWNAHNALLIEKRGHVRFQFHPPPLLLDRIPLRCRRARALLLSFAHALFQDPQSFDLRFLL